MSKAVLANKTTERSQTAFCLLSATISRLPLPLTFSVWHHLFLSAVVFITPFLSSTWLTLPRYHQSTPAPFLSHFSFHLGSGSLPVTPVSRHRRALLAAPLLRPPSRGWGPGRKAMTVHMGCIQRAQSRAFTAITGNGARQAEDVF